LVETGEEVPEGSQLALAPIELELVSPLVIESGSLALPPNFLAITFSVPTPVFTT
jgi:hypothetical protein